MVATRPEDLKNPSGKTISDGDRQSVLSEEQRVREQVQAIIKMLDILKIPTQERDAAADELMVALQECEDVAKYGRINANFRSFERIVLLCKKLLDEFRRLNGSGRRFLGDYDDESFKLFPSAIQKLAARAGLLRPGKRAAHRPDRSIKNPVAQIFVFELYRVVGKFGGKLTLGMHISARKPNGSLPAALAVLHNLLPTIVPRNIPYQTLRRMRRHAIEELRRLSSSAGPPPPEQVRGGIESEKSGAAVDIGH
jgi:hypothetical protein